MRNTKIYLFTCLKKLRVITGFHITEIFVLFQSVPIKLRLIFCRILLCMFSKRASVESLNLALVSLSLFVVFRVVLVSFVCLCLSRILLFIFVS